MVLPVPKPPGMAAVPPFASGNMVSRIRCPVISGFTAGKRLADGLGIRMGHFWVMVSFFSVPSISCTVSSVSSMVYGPSGMTSRT